MTEVNGYVNPNARIMLVGEAPGNEEMYEGRPFIGASGRFLDDMLTDAGLRRDDLYVTNVCRIQPPKNKIGEFFSKKSDAKKLGLKEIDDKFPKRPVLEGIVKLMEEIERVDPEIIVAAGNTALWALTGLSGTGKRTTSPVPTGITSWRGSQLVTKSMFGRRKVVPIIHPAGILRKMDQRWYTVIDLKRAQLDGGRRDWSVPEYRFIVRPSYHDVCNVLSNLERRANSGGDVLQLALDVETRLRCIACIGVAWSKLEAICIPVMCVENHRGYFSIEEETEILWRLYQLVRHPNVRIIGQNWDYDRQYFARNYGLNIPAHRDTMVRQHVLLPGTPKGLDFLSSIFCSYHVYWKDEGKEWDPSMNEEQLWIYNCKDAVITYEVSDKQEPQLENVRLKEQEKGIMRQADPVFYMELRGINCDLVELHKQRTACEAYLSSLADWLDDVVPQRVLPRPPIPPGPYDDKWWKTNQHPIVRKKRKAFWFDSPDQTKHLLYDILCLPTKFKVDKEKGRIPTVEDTALEELKEDEPALIPLLEALIQYRSFKTLLANFLGSRRDWDKRNRTSLSYAGPETYRYSSSTDVFGFGSNVQNITKGDK